MHCEDKSPLTGPYIFYGLELYIAFSFPEQDKDNSMKLFLNRKLYILFSGEGCFRGHTLPRPWTMYLFHRKGQST